MKTMAEYEALDEALEAEEREIAEDPERLVETLWNWHDESAENEKRLGTALVEFQRNGLTGNLSRVLEWAIKAQAREIIGHVDEA